MINRFLRVVVFILSVILMIPAAILTPISFVLFNYSLVSAVSVIGINAMTDEDWDYKTFLDYVK